MTIDNLRERLLALAERLDPADAELILAAVKSLFPEPRRFGETPADQLAAEYEQHPEKLMEAIQRARGKPTASSDA